MYKAQALKGRFRVGILPRMARLFALPFIAFLLSAISPAIAGVERTFSVGNDRSSLGLIIEPNLECVAPLALSAEAVDQFAILDAANGRVIVNRRGAMELLALPVNSIPLDVVIAEEGVIVLFADGVLRLLARNMDPADIAELAGIETVPGPRLRVLDANTVLVTASDGSVLLELALGQRVRLLEPAAHKGELQSGSSPQEARLFLQTPSDGKELSISTAWPIVGAEVLGIGAKGNVVVAIQEQRLLPQPGAATRLILYDAKGQSTGEAYIAPSILDCGKPLAVAYTADGKVLQLVVISSNSIVLQSTDWRPLGTLALPATQAISTSQPIANDNFFKQFESVVNGGSTLEIAAMPATSVDRIVARAELALNTQWWMLPQNYSREGVPNVCTPQSSNWQRPPVLDGRTGLAIFGVPYRWGGYFSEISSFQTNLDGSKLAGDVCTCRTGPTYCIVPEATGLDCSGFVSFAWQIGQYLTTSSLSEAGRKIEWDEVRVSDIVNRKGSHVRLVVAVHGSGPRATFETIESSVTCGGVCRRTYTRQELIANAYVPLRRPNLTAN